ncbi:MAG: GNAT family N-acetyltransferase [Aggregatilineales bacterium]
MADQSLHIRPAVAEDADGLALLWRDNADTLTKLDPRFRLAPDGMERWRAAFLNELTRDQRHTVVAARDRTLVGCMTGLIMPNAPGFLPEQIGAITEMIVDSHGRGGGIGTGMLEMMSAWFVAHGITAIEAHAPVHNPIAQAFWRAIGAVEVTQQMRIKLPVVVPHA